MRLSQNIAQVFSTEDESVTLETLMDRISFKSFGVFLIILSLPSALPVPAPGYSVPFGLALMYLGVQVMARRDHPWFPEFVRQRRIPAKGNARLVRWMVKFLAFFEYFVRPRVRFVYTNPISYRFLGLVITICAISMCSPIPLTNTVPALGIFLIGLGMLEEDGLGALVGLLVALAGLALSLTVHILVLRLGWEAVDLVRNWVKGLLGMEEAAAALLLALV